MYVPCACLAGNGGAMLSLSSLIGLLFFTISTRITAVKFKLPVLFCKLLSNSKLPSKSPAAVPKSLLS
jgi:hypothetical protein